MRFGVEIDRKDEVCALTCSGEHTSAVGSLVAGTFVDCVFGRVVLRRQEMDHRHREVQLA